MLHGRADDSLLIHGMDMPEQDSAGRGKGLMNDIGGLKGADEWTEFILGSEAVRVIP
jgi:hypothetical protein